MAESYGPGVSRTLSAANRAFETVVWQKGKPPLDSEISLIGQVATEQTAELIRSQMHSGWLIDPTRCASDFHVEQRLSNLFFFGQQSGTELAPLLQAVVNGHVVSVTGTQVGDGDTSNGVALNPPPASDARIDLVFLEVWTALVAPNPSTDNKPTASTIYPHGNIEYGGTNITDDLEDATIGFETTKRVQVQYCIRVYGSGAGLGSSVALDVYPDGLDDTNVLAQGTATSPVAGMTFTNMRLELGDPSLWRAGDGDPTNDLGTTDGYVYAVPIAAIFRRNSSGFEAVGVGTANQNGGRDRNPSASSLTNPRDGAKPLSSPVLTSDISESATGAIAITNLADSGFDDADIDLPSTFIVIDGEVIGPITAVSGTTLTIGVSARGRNATMAVPHLAGASVSFFNSRTDGLFADQIAAGDILDLRRAVTAGDWDYQRLLVHNLAKLVQGNLRTSYKQGMGNSEGAQVVEVSYLLADGTAVPLSTAAVDGPDGIRTVFSDAASIQPEVTVLCISPTAAGPVAAFDAGVEWDVAADFQPSGFSTAVGYANGTVVFLNIGGSDGTAGARGTFRDGSTQAVRFVSPIEYWKTDLVNSTTGNQSPVQVRFLNANAFQPSAYGESTAAHPGPMHPDHANNFEKPFIVLGGVLNTASAVGVVDVFNNSPAASEYEVQLSGLDFDAADGWYPTGDLTSLDPAGIANPCLRGQKTLYDLLTAGGRDRTGGSSEVYLVMYGDSTNPKNNGAFQVIGAGTVGYTDASASATDRIRVRFLSQGVTTFTTPVVGSLSAELRTMFTNAEDGPGGSATFPASLALVWTDIEGAVSGSRWAGALSSPVSQKMVISTTLQYHPGRGATARVLDSMDRVAGVTLGAEYLRNAPGSVDASFPTAAGVPANETYFDVNHVQTWNRLPSLGLNAPVAPSYGGNIAGFSEQTRESEVFVDRGSKTLVLRPFTDRSMTLQARTSRATGTDTLLGLATYPGLIPIAGTPKDGALIWTAGKHMGFEVPPEYMPRFGRQDIPFHVGSGTFLPGINHLFTDSTDVTEAQHYVIGGQDSTSTTIRPLYVQTGTGTGFDFGEYGTIAGPSTPAYQGQVLSQPGVISSDLGRGMVGIQLPPYLGIARLYGVYDRRDFIAQGGATFNADRVTVAASPATNLLRTDATKQTLFILQGGGEDFTGDANDHTYMVPSEAVDITLSPTYLTGETFADIDYVVEFSCFGFARGFINKNNYVLCRRHKGTGTAIVDSTFATGTATVTVTPLTGGDTLTIGGKVLTGFAGVRTSGSNNFNTTLGSVTLIAADIVAAINDKVNHFAAIVTATSSLGVVTLKAVASGTAGNAITLTTVSGGRITVSGATFTGGTGTDPEASGARMTIPAAASSGDAVYVAGTRTPYQGDPYMTRAGETRTVTDYDTRYGQVPIASQFELASSIQQFTSAGVLIPEIPNVRSLQVLAAVDFYTTLGTGKVGGQLYAGTLLDVGHTEDSTAAASRVPGTGTDPAWRVLPRGFTEGQRTNDSHAQVGVAIVDNTSLSGKSVSFTIPSESVVILVAGTNFTVGGSAIISAANLAAAINAHVVLGRYLTATSSGTTVVTVVSNEVGAVGNQNRVSISNVTVLALQIPQSGNRVVNLTSSRFSGGVDINVNGGNGTSQLDLTGMIERLPLGILLQDSDFICENPLNDQASALATQPPGIQPVQSLLPLADGGAEYTRFLGGPGQWLGMADGGIMQYTAYNVDTAPTGTKRFRLFRGGGSAYVTSDPVPGGPVDWVSGTFPASVEPVLKGGILICKALLVRNLPEEAFSTPQTTTQGDEVQLVILTYGHLGRGDEGNAGITLAGEISPTGYGEGYAAADRYRIDGRPMSRGRARIAPEGGSEPAVYPDTGARPL